MNSDSSSLDPNVIAVVQARIASIRLPGKVLADIQGVPLLVRELSRADRAATVNGLVVATSTGSDDDAIEASCQEHGFDVFRGSALDVLDRVYLAAQESQADIVVRLTGDCPLIDPMLIDQTVQAFLDAEPSVDFAANRLPDDKSFPVGTDVEVCSLSALERAWREADKPHHREHVMPYLYEVPGQFKTLLVRSDQDYSLYRWTVDTSEDLELIRKIYAHFGGRDDFTWQEVLDLYAREPSLASVNAEVPHKSQFDLDPGWSS